MKLSPKPRQFILGIALCLTLVATVYVSKQESSSQVVQPVQQMRAPRQADGTKQTTDAPTRLPLEKLQQRSVANKSDPNMFAAKSWYVPPPPPPKPAKPLAPPPPTAPPLPFTFMGLFQEDSGRLVVYLTKGDRAYTVSEGDVIDNLYKVESATTRQLTLVYIPLSIKQTLMTGTGS